MSLYHIAVPTFTRTLTSLRNILTKAEAHAEAANIEPSVLVNARLAPNMFPLKRQVQIACDSARRGCGQLTGADVPAIEDTEESFAELIARIDTSLKFVSDFTEQQFEGAEEKVIELPLSTGSIKLDGTSFLMGYAMSNFSFHCITAYNILRHNGVVLGKMDYLGTP
ncbi:MAG: hypothetical protein ACJAYE_002739 [Candidatus Azotimanducaceae bacterium]|jgi:hypothetical protein